MLGKPIAAKTSDFRKSFRFISCHAHVEHITIDADELARYVSLRLNRRGEKDRWQS